MSVSDQTRITYRFERLRAATAGIIDTAGSTFLLLIAVRWFDMGATAKALIASGASLGLLISPLILSFVSHRQWPAARAASGIFFTGSALFVTAAAFPVLTVFIVAGVLAMACATVAIPLLTQVYQDNYPTEKRGRLFSRTFIVRIAAIILFSKFAGDFLSQNMDRFPVLLGAFAAAFAFSGWCMLQIPSRTISNDRGTHPLRALRYVKEDALFRRTLISWMILGFANLMMLPLRVEYLANEAYGLVLAVTTIALLTEIIPNIARLVLSQFWGWLFDHMNFFALRCLLNIGFAIGITVFFVGETMTAFVIGAIVYGVSRSGGDVAWSLWVTKLAPPDRVADYMAVHTFFTGARGVVAPVIGFHAIMRFDVGTMGIFSAVMIILATLMLVPEIKTLKKIREGQPLVEEISE